jgi:histidinol-phosphate/aromatic aminotransferase/cobyric acid decarboxylase-like protein
MSGRSAPLDRPGTAALRHHGDREVGDGLLDLAVNVHDAPLPTWLADALTTSLADLARYPDPNPATEALAGHHGVDPGALLPTAGAAEAFTLVARLRTWRRPVVVHPQFTEPDVALETAGHRPEHVLLDGDFTLDTLRVPEDADLVVVGNPTNPTGVRHRAAQVLALRCPGRLLVVDEAFCDDDRESVLGHAATAEGPGDLLVIRSLTKLWAIPGLRAGYVVAPAPVVSALRHLQPPWSVSTPAVAAMVASTTDGAAVEARRRVADVRRWRAHLRAGLAALAIPHLSGDPTTPFVLARPGPGVHAALRRTGIAVRRCDTFPGLDDTWVRIAVRPEPVTDALLDALR